MRTSYHIAHIDWHNPNLKLKSSDSHDQLIAYRYAALDNQASGISRQAELYLNIHTARGMHIIFGHSKNDFPFRIWDAKNIIVNKVQLEVAYDNNRVQTCISLHCASLQFHSSVNDWFQGVGVIGSEFHIFRPACCTTATIASLAHLQHQTET